MISEGLQQINDLDALCLCSQPNGDGLVLTTDNTLYRMWYFPSEHRFAFFKVSSHLKLPSDRSVRLRLVANSATNSFSLVSIEGVQHFRLTDSLLVEPQCVGLNESELPVANEEKRTGRSRLRQLASDLKVERGFDAAAGGGDESDSDPPSVPRDQLSLNHAAASAAASASAAAPSASASASGSGIPSSASASTAASTAKAVPFHSNLKRSRIKAELDADAPTPKRSTLADLSSAPTVSIKTLAGETFDAKIPFVKMSSPALWSAALVSKTCEAISLRLDEDEFGQKVKEPSETISTAVGIKFHGGVHLFAENAVGLKKNGNLMVEPTFPDTFGMSFRRKGTKGEHTLGLSVFVECTGNHRQLLTFDSVEVFFGIATSHAIVRVTIDSTQIALKLGEWEVARHTHAASIASATASASSSSAKPAASASGSTASPIL